MICMTCWTQVVQLTNDAPLSGSPLNDRALGLWLALLRPPNDGPQVTVLVKGRSSMSLDDRGRGSWLVAKERLWLR